MSRATQHESTVAHARHADLRHESSHADDQPRSAVHKVSNYLLRRELEAVQRKVAPMVSDATPDDREDAYERSADEVAARVGQGEPVESPLDTVVGAGSNRAASVQRKIVIGGKDYNPTNDLYRVMQQYGRASVVALLHMHHDGKAPPLFRYATNEQLMTELRLREGAVDGMTKANANRRHLRYAEPGDPPGGHLDPKFWDQKGSYAFVLKTGAKPADAVRAIFDSEDNVLECNSTMVAVEYRSLLGAMGETRFNQKFAGGGLVISRYHHKMPNGHEHPFSKEMFDKVPITGEKDLIPGDWVYFENVSGYLKQHPSGDWAGEHALYLGDGKFQGFGTEVLTQEELSQELLDKYNNGLSPEKQKGLADVHGLLKWARRPVAEKMVK